jgi:hypothetical protein
VWAHPRILSHRSDAQRCEGYSLQTQVLFLAFQSIPPRSCSRLGMGRIVLTGILHLSLVARSVHGERERVQGAQALSSPSRILIFEPMRLNPSRGPWLRRQVEISWYITPYGSDIFSRGSIQQPHFCLRSYQKLLHPAFRKTIALVTMAARKTRFTLLGFETAKAIQILGSWNGYSEYLALVRDEDSTAWKGTFPLALQPGQHRYHVWTPLLRILLLFSNKSIVSHRRVPLSRT